MADHGNNDWLLQYEKEMRHWKEHTDWTIAHRRMLVRESAGRDLGNFGVEWTILLFDVVACVVLALAWLR